MASETSAHPQGGNASTQCRSAESRSRSPVRDSCSKLPKAWQPQACALNDPEDEPGLVRVLEESLPPDTRRRLRKLFDDGSVQPHVFDQEALTGLIELSEELQDKVMSFLESDRQFLMHARSKSAFLVAAVQKAKAGSLDAVGLGSYDPWRPYLMSIARPKSQLLDLVPEQEWLAQHGAEPARLVIDVSVDPSLRVQIMELTVDLRKTTLVVKQRLAEIGVGIPVHKMKLKEQTLGFLRDCRTLAYYNLSCCSTLQLQCRIRGGVAQRRGQVDLTKLSVHC